MQRFVQTRDCWMAFLRDRDTYYRGTGGVTAPTPPGYESRRRCHIIPMEVVRDLHQIDDEIPIASTEFTQTDFTFQEENPQFVALVHTANTVHAKNGSL